MVVLPIYPVEVAVGTELKAAVSLKTSDAAYSPLVAYQAGNGNRFGGYWIDVPEINNGIKHSYSTALDELYLAPGYAMDVHLSGGPERWDLHVEYVESVEVTGEQDLPVTDGVQVRQTHCNGRRLYTALCLSVGQFVCTL
ncbi:hypothetical protein MA16_Dca000476 [Dendrobium catenatum]|uniref:NUP210 Ig-like domain-containing protein n=1 Tax=Dendrobium catenatum TaxID=906689 RepID=A0A2I0WTY7_9ASPA|nr:hypothetical protein MA16_Dca000476 [Dendrobium catenatum]